MIETQRVRLRQSEVSVLTSGKTDHLEARWIAVDDLQRLGANGAGGAEDDDAPAQGFSHC
jgi:hypothetical protein